MSTLIKVVVALCIGAGLMHYAQRQFLRSMAAQVAAQEQQQPAMLANHAVVPTVKFDAAQMTRQLNGGIGPIDTSAGERAALESAARRADLMRRRAESQVPRY